MKGSPFFHRRKFYAAGVCFLFFLLFLFYIRYVHFSQKNLPVVDIAFAGTGELTSSVYATGIITSARKVTVQAKTQGIIKDVFVGDGESVKEGQILLQIETKELEAQVKAAETNLEAAKANKETLHDKLREEQAKANVETQKLGLEQARKNYEVTKELFKVKAVAKENVEQAEAQFKQAELATTSAKKQLTLVKNNPSPSQKQAVEAQIHQSELTLEVAKKQRDDASIVSPMDGIVMFTPVGPLEKIEKGIAVSPGVPLLAVADNRSLQVVTRVEEANGEDVQSGQEARVTSSLYPEEMFRGRITRVSPYTTGTGEISSVEVTVTLDKLHKKLKLGSKVDVEIVKEKKTGALLIPKQAVFTCGGNYCVFSYFEGKIRLKKVEVGLSNDKNVEILRGVRLGETVVVSPSKELRPGMSVKVKDNEFD